METKRAFILGLVAVTIFLTFSAPVESGLLFPLNRTSFPAGFIFGAGSSAYQFEGAANVDGRGPSIWDNFTHQYPEKIADGSNGDVAVDFYHRYKDDIQLMKKIGLDSFRFSISWSRIFPTGKVSGGPNPLGVKFYNDLIDNLIANGIKPFATLLHFDLPQALEDEYLGLLSSKIVDDYRDYVDFCFKTFGDRVKLWATINEPNIWAINGYVSGINAPGRCSSYAGNCTAGNSATEPYIAVHHLLLMHGAAWKLYQQKYKASQKGEIGITIAATWFTPMYNTTSAQVAANRSLDWLVGWIAYPITYGDYPPSMRKSVGSRLPNFTAEETKTLNGSYDFLTLNYYTTYYSEIAPPANGVNVTYATDRRSTETAEKNGVPIGTPTYLSWLYIYPRGIYELLVYTRKNYNNPTIYISENGLADNAAIPMDVELKDSTRIRYISSHLSYLYKAIQAGVKAKGYYVWSFLDDFELSSGFTIRFGITYVDYTKNLTRTLKYSSYWYKNFLLT